MDNDILLKQVIRRLDILIALQIESFGGPEAGRTTTKIERLSNLGLLPSEVAAIIAKPTNYVTATLSKKKKTSKVKESNK